ncbi:hypothetical protein PENSTE_c001G05143 [Penicillium steckii]|uniref:Zn(2)-C6 fungal-type domain-containing protein n=1 Tax=Penicillium steckii TaxID=303698 RepID=A0A1V6TZA4_9EURO|nr:hypothetical protein PENSTE_c001G05143 [Penicillium steckii]
MLSLNSKISSFLSRSEIEGRNLYVYDNYISCTLQFPKMSHISERRKPRKKAVRSCSNCQKSHKTCGNERPCEQCIKRGIPLDCVDGSRKRPKYLCDDLSGKKSNDLDQPICRGPVEGGTWLDQGVGNQVSKTFVDATFLEGQLYTNQNSSTTQDLVEYVDPRVLHNSFLESNGCMIGPSELAHYPGEYKNVFSISQMTAFPQPHPQSEFEETSAINVDKKYSTFGFAIKSGWASTFFT